MEIWLFTLTLCTLNSMTSIPSSDSLTNLRTGSYVMQWNCVCVLIYDTVAFYLLSVYVEKLSVVSNSLTTTNNQQKKTTSMRTNNKNNCNLTSDNVTNISVSFADVEVARSKWTLQSFKQLITKNAFYAWQLTHKFDGYFAWKLFHIVYRCFNAEVKCL